MGRPRPRWVSFSADGVPQPRRREGEGRRRDDVAEQVHPGQHDFSPGTIEVKSGQTLTFEYEKKTMEPHTLTIVKQGDLPKTGAQVENCSACQKLATGHLKNPKAEPGPSNPIVHWTLNKGKPGLDRVGDSIAIDSTAKPAHTKNSIKVTAKAGTTLYFLCAVHPWMQGKIVVK